MGSLKGVKMAWPIFSFKNSLRRRRNTVIIITIFLDRERRGKDEIEMAGEEVFSDKSDREKCGVINWYFVFNF